ALGAERARLVRQVLVESLAVFVLAGALGVGWAGLALRALASWVPTSVPRLGNVELDLPVVAVALAVAALAGLASGLVPALQSAGSSGLGTRRALGRSLPRLRAGLVGAQVALALVLLVAGGAMLQAVRGQLAIDPGFRSEGLITFSLALPRAQYQEQATLVDFWDGLFEGLEALPGVRSAGAVSFAPLSGLGAATSYHPADRPAPPPGESIYTDVRVVAGDFHRTLGIPLLAGRLFDEQDRTPSDRRPVVVSRALAEEAWPGEAALGRELVVSWGGPETSVVIGVVGDVRYTDLSTEPRAALYWPIELEPSLAMTASVATEGDPQALAPAIRSTVAAADPGIPIESLRTMRSVVRDSVARERFALQVVSAFGLVALALAAVGLYGAMTLLVRARRSEIGLRLALGASPGGVARAVVGRALRLVTAALLVGVALAAAGGRIAGAAIGSLFGEVSIVEPAVLGGAVAALLLAALLASAPAAVRAARLDPATTLREE
ncbi:MAG TPA: FtsX-like permease family protein, partial [Thermoanaerobaculia bacterium]|nr:FtsX-like permease family protein [Thermoanaerobaculia bacterium]